MRAGLWSFSEEPKKHRVGFERGWGLVCDGCTLQLSVMVLHSLRYLGHGYKQQNFKQIERATSKIRTNMKNKALENGFPHEIVQFIAFYNLLIDVFSKTHHRPSPQPLQQWHFLSDYRGTLSQALNALNLFLPIFKIK